MVQCLRCGLVPSTGGEGPGTVRSWRGEGGYKGDVHGGEQGGRDRKGRKERE